MHQDKCAICRHIGFFFSTGLLPVCGESQLCNCAFTKPAFQFAKGAPSPRLEIQIRVSLAIQQTVFFPGNPRHVL